MIILIYYITLVSYLHYFRSASSTFTMTILTRRMRAVREANQARAYAAQTVVSPPPSSPPLASTSAPVAVIAPLAAPQPGPSSIQQAVTQAVRQPAAAKKKKKKQPNQSATVSAGTSARSGTVSVGLQTAAFGPVPVVTVNMGSQTECSFDSVLARRRTFGPHSGMLERNDMKRPKNE